MIERMKKMWGSQYVFFGILLTVAVACSGDEPETNNEYVNKWVNGVMRTFYLWNDDLPSPNKNQPPKAFFDKLLSADDRFSWIQENYVDLLNSLSGVNKEAGFESSFYQINGTDEVIGHVKYIKPNSPAEEKGLKRGDIITEINTYPLTTDNANDLIPEMNKSYSIRYARYNESTESWVDQGDLNFEPIEYAENPNFLDKVIEVGDHKIGYYVYNFFAPDNGDDSFEYNNDMNAVFSRFKAANITDLIVDLRYNSGGSEAATIKLASLIGTNIDASKVFVNRQYNSEVTEAYADDPDFFHTNFTAEANNVGSLIGGKVYIITSSERTASASELLINGLRPFMDVIIVGGTTIGKNVGSFSFYKQNDPKNKWGIQPICVKSFNSNMQSDYSEGFDPDVEIDENSYNLVLAPLGDVDEPLLSTTIEQITGVAARVPHAKRGREVSEIKMPAMFKRPFSLIIDNKHVTEKLQNQVKSMHDQVQ